MAKYIQRLDGEGFSYRSGEVWRLACCDCGLVHDVVLIAGKGRVGIAARRNNRATAARRKSGKRDARKRKARASV